MGDRARIPGKFILPLLLGVDTSVGAWADSSLLSVTNEAELYAAVRRANRDGHTVVSLAPGHYRLDGPLKIDGDHVTLRSRDGDRDTTVIQGRGMKLTTGVDNLIEVSGKHVSIIGLTLRDTGNHLIQLRGERDADYFHLINCALLDGYEQLLKVSADRQGSSADYGVVKDSLFAYTQDLGPNYYIGGIDLHRGANWVIQRNTFRNISSPRDQVAEFAIHLWSGSADSTVRDNLIINSDRGIGFGLGEDWFRRNDGGEISGNVILHLRTSDPFADVGIALENSPGTQVIGNYVYLAHAYPNAIEYRFPGTSGVVISGNSVNRAITSRDGGEAFVEGNRELSPALYGWDWLVGVVQRLRYRLSY